MKKLVLFVITIVTIFFFINLVSAQEELLLQINLFDDGSASVIGSSTINPEIEDIEYDNQTQAIYGITQHLTSKHEERWSFSLDMNTDFKSSYIKIVLPEDAKLGTISSVIEPLISTDGNKIILEFMGNEISPDISFYYELESGNRNDSGYYFLIFALIISITIVVSWLIFRKRKKKDKEKPKKEETITIKKSSKKSKKIKRNSFEEKLKLIRPTLNERENKIINELLEHKKLKQNQLQSLTKIPKVSLSRHLANLENKNLIIKKNLGKTNIIQINKSFDKKEKKE